MKKLILLCFVILIFTSLVYGLCEEGQIDINSASLEKLKEIIHVGPKVAEYIIEARPFNSIDELVNVSYISSGYLEDIKNQGLACVNGFEEELKEEPEKETVEEENITEEIVNNKDDFVEVGGLGGKAPLTSEVIKLSPLSPKDIKSEEDRKILDKSQYVKYGFVIFCILLGILFILKNRKKNKNELV